LHVRRLLVLAIRGIGSRPSSLSAGVVLIALLAFLVWSLFLVNRTTLFIEAETRFVSFDVSDGGFFTLQIEDGWAFMPPESPMDSVELKENISGILDLRGTLGVELRAQHDGDNLELRFSGPEGAARPLIGQTEIPFDTPVRLGAAARRKIAVLAGEAMATLGAPPQSNQADFLLLNANARFEQYIVGLGSIPVLEEDGLQFKELSVVDPSGEQHLSTRVLVDLSGGPMKVSLEAFAPKNEMALGIRSLNVEEPRLLVPSFMDRLAANPLVGLGTAVIALVLLFGQLIALLVPIRSAGDD